VYLFVCRKIRDVIRRIFEKKRHAVAPADGGRAMADHPGSFFGGRHRQRNADLQYAAVVSRYGLKAEMLAMPFERPALLKAIQHFKVSSVPAMRRTDGEFHAMDDNRQRAA